MPSFRCTEWTPSAFRRNRARWKAHICRASSQGLQWRRGWRWRAASLGAHHSSTGAYRRRSALRSGASLFARRVLVFHISGGTTELLLCSGTSVVCRVGGSTDLYAGQAVDRIGVKLGFAFPAGAELSSLASECSEEIKPKVSVKGADCSFSGLETSAPHCWNVAQPRLTLRNIA